MSQHLRSGSSDSSFSIAGWRGYLIGWFALVWIANVYMSLFNRLRLDIKHENVAIAVDQTVLPSNAPQKRS